VDFFTEIDEDNSVLTDSKLPFRIKINLFESIRPCNRL